MKKMMLLLALAGMSTGAMAQEATTNETPTQKHRVITNRFGDNWFIDFGGDFLTNYSSQEQGLSLNPFSMDRGNFAFNVSAGKWITPGFGMRLKAQAAWARVVNGMEDNCECASPLTNPLYNQFNLNLQPMLNLHNLFAGYKPRVWNTILYGSAGWMYNFDAPGHSSVMIGAGWLNQFNVTKRFHINVDIYTNMGEADMDGYSHAHGAPMIGTRDWHLGWSVGCGFNLGKVGWDNAPDVDAIMAMNKAQLDALNASLSEQQDENEKLQSMIKNHKCPEAPKMVTEIIATNASVFFNINQSKIASKKDLINVQELVQFAKANGKTIVVTGYADSKTGSASYNQKLSERRAETVANEIAKMGISRDKIEVIGKGGVKDLSPISYNRRAVVTLK